MPKETKAEEEQKLQNFLAAVELGYRLCEKGNNLQATIEKAKKAWNEEDQDDRH